MIFVKEKFTMARIGARAWYKDWFNSPFYHRLYFERDEAEAKAFIHKLIHFLQPLPGSRMLDVACGRGRHSRILAELAFDVTGFDLSFESINYAKQLGQKDNLSFYQHDMRLPFWINYFNYAFNFFTSFGYFKTMREHNDAIRTIAQSLKLNGVFVIDYLNAHYVENNLVAHEEKKMGNVLFTIDRRFDEDKFYKRIQVNDE